MSPSYFKVRGGNPTRYLLHITIRRAQPSRKPLPGRKASKKRSKVRKNTSRGKGKKPREMAKRYGSRRRSRRRRRRRSPLRGVRRSQRRRRRVRFGQPLSPFFLFMADYRPQLQRKYPNWTSVEIVEKLGRSWHRQPKEEKRRYKRLSAKLRRNFTGESYW